MLNIELTRIQVLDLMKELPEDHWIQNKLVQVLHHKETIQKLEDSTNDKSVDKPKLAAKDVVLHNHYDPKFMNKEYIYDELTKCDFLVAWRGKCGKNTIKYGEQCPEHYNIKCSLCNNVATNDCGETFQFVCGAPLCKDHENKHTCNTKNRMYFR